MNEQIETYRDAMLVAYIEGDFQLFERIVNVLKDIISDEKFHKDLNEYENEREKKLKKIFKDADERARKAIEEQKTPELWNTLGEIQTSLSDAIVKLESEYYDTIKTYIVEYIRRKYGET